MAIATFGQDTNESAFTGTYYMPPKGQHNAVLCDFIPLGPVTTQYGTGYKIRPAYQIEEFISSDDENHGKPYKVNGQKMNLSLGPKSSLYKLITGAGWLREGDIMTFDPDVPIETNYEELWAFFLQFVGRPCQVIIEHHSFTSTEGKEITYAQVAAGAVTPKHKKDDALVVTDYVMMHKREAWECPPQPFMGSIKPEDGDNYMKDSIPF